MTRPRRLAFSDEFPKSCTMDIPPTPDSRAGCSPVLFPALDDVETTRARAFAYLMTLGIKSRIQTDTRRKAAAGLFEAGSLAMKQQQIALYSDAHFEVSKLLAEGLRVTKHPRRGRPRSIVLKANSSSDDKALSWVWAGARGQSRYLPMRTLRRVIRGVPATNSRRRTVFGGRKNEGGQNNNEGTLQA